MASSSHVFPSHYCLHSARYLPILHLPMLHMQSSELRQPKIWRKGTHFYIICYETSTSGCCPLTLLRSLDKVLLLFTWRMTEMQRMPYVHLTELNLVERGVNFVLSGPSKNETGVSGVLRHPKNHHLLQDPQKTLFVINFDPYNTRTRDLEKHFDPYGKVLNVRIRKNFAFIQYESLDDAIKALDATNLSKLLDRVITVEFAIKDDDARRNGYSPDRARDRSPVRGYDRMRSPSLRRERGSPDYGHNKGRSPSPRRREQSSPKYDLRSSRSPSHKVTEPKYGRGLSTSPRNERKSLYNDKHNSVPLRDRSDNVMVRSPSPGKRATPDYGQGSSPSPPRGQRPRVGHDDFDSEQKPAYSDGESPPQERYGSRSPVVEGRSRSRS